MSGRDYAVAVAWYEQLLGAEPSFLPIDTEAVWELAEHRYVFIEVLPENAGHAVHTVFVSDFDTCIAGIAARGLEPVKSESYDNGVRKGHLSRPGRQRDRVRWDAGVNTLAVRAHRR